MWTQKVKGLLNYIVYKPYSVKLSTKEGQIFPKISSRGLWITLYKGLKLRQSWWCWRAPSKYCFLYGKSVETVWTSIIHKINSLSQKESQFDFFSSRFNRGILPICLIHSDKKTKKLIENLRNDIMKNEEIHLNDRIEFNFVDRSSQFFSPYEAKFGRGKMIRPLVITKIGRSPKSVLVKR